MKKEHTLKQSLGQFARAGVQLTDDVVKAGVIGTIKTSGFLAKTGIVLGGVVGAMISKDLEKMTKGFYRHDPIRAGRDLANKTDKVDKVSAFSIGLTKKMFGER